MGKKMIYSPGNNFLLLKNIKVGGTSLEVEVSKIVPPSAIVTQITPSNPNHFPRNCENFLNHMSYTEISKTLDLSNVKSYIVVRNPYDTVLSDFFFACEIKERWHNISEFQKNLMLEKYFNDEYYIPWLHSTKYLYMSKDGKVQVDKFLKYENGLENEINDVLPLHGLPKIQINTFEKSGYKPKNIKYTDVFSKEHIKTIEDEWSWEFANLGYKKHIDL